MASLCESKVKNGVPQSNSKHYLWVRTQVSLVDLKLLRAKDGDQEKTNKTKTNDDNNTKSIERCALPKSLTV